MAIYVPMRVRGWSSFIQGAYLAKQPPIAGADIAIPKSLKTDTGTYHSTYGRNDGHAPPPKKHQGPRVWPGTCEDVQSLRHAHGPPLLRIKMEATGVIGAS